MKCVFGEIENGRMKLNEYGKIVEKYLKVIPDKYHNFDQFLLCMKLHGEWVSAVSQQFP